MPKILHPKVYEDDNIQIYLEVGPENKLFAHCNVTRWTPSIYKEFLQIWINLLDSLRSRGFDKIYTGVDNEKLLKFVGMFGFVGTNYVYLDTRGTVRQVFECSI